MTSPPPERLGATSPHVWVRAADPHAQWPGLILERRRGGQDGPAGFEALVTYLERQAGGVKATTEWVPYSQLTPVPWRPSLGTAYG